MTTIVKNSKGSSKTKKPVEHKLSTTARNFLVDYAKKRAMPKGIVAQHEKGELDHEPLPQLLAVLDTHHVEAKAKLVGQNAELEQNLATSQAEVARLNVLLAQKDKIIDQHVSTLSTMHNDHKQQSHTIGQLRVKLQDIRKLAEGLWFGKGAAIVALIEKDPK